MSEARDAAAPRLDPHDTAHPLPLGELLVQEGLVSPEQVDRAIELQAHEAQRGVFLRLGELLVSMGAIEARRVQEVLARQGLTILYCSQCLAQFNVLGTKAPAEYRCRRCARPLERPPTLERLSVEDTVGPTELLEEGEEERNFGPYVILGRISRGGMGVIYKARQKSLDRVVAVKVLADSGGGERERFRREALAVARLRHPYIVAVHEVGQIRGVDYFSMDYVEGLPLDKAIASEAYSHREIVEIFVKVCDAVDYAHGEGLLHRDLKPSNVLVDRKRNPTLIDFGIAKSTDSLEESGDELVGSPAYLPPEYLTGDGPYAVAGEIYALGATLYTALGGKTPHTGLDTVHILRTAQREEPVPLRAIQRSVDRDLGTIVMTALARSPAARYRTVRELANDLRRWLDGDEVAGRRSSFGRMWSRIRGRVAAALGLVISFALLFVSVTSTWDLNRLRGEAELAGQLERERNALLRRLIDTKLKLARRQLDAGDAREASLLLTDLLQLDGAGPYAARIHALRAEARDALGDPEGAAADREAAAHLTGR